MVPAIVCENSNKYILVKLYLLCFVSTLWQKSPQLTSVIHCASNTSHCKDLNLYPVQKRKIKRICSTVTREEFTNPPFLYNEACSFRMFYGYSNVKFNEYQDLCQHGQDVQFLECQPGKHDRILVIKLCFETHIQGTCTDACQVLCQALCSFYVLQMLVS